MDKKQQERSGDDYRNIMGRDGFSPDLPRALASTGDLRGVGWAMRLALYMLSGMQKGTLDVLLPNGVVRHFEGPQPGPHGVWRIKHPGGLMRHVLASGEVGIGDAYLDDCWDSPDLAGAAPELYIRETRHISGLTKLTAEDVKNSTMFPDRIALCAYSMDLHPYKRGENMRRAKQPCASFYAPRAQTYRKS